MPWFHLRHLQFTIETLICLDLILSSIVLGYSQCTLHYTRCITNALGSDLDKVIIQLLGTPLLLGGAYAFLLWSKIIIPNLIRIVKGCLRFFGAIVYG